MRLRQRDGAYTRDLVRQPGGFGLGQVPLRLKPDATTAMVCGFCSTGCALDVHLRDGTAVNVTPNTDYPVNLGMACPKGWEALSPLNAPDRATMPLWRDAKGRYQPVAWPVAIATFVERFKAILAEHGPDSVAFLSTGQIATEEMALLGALAKFGMGLIHGDGNTRQCMATSVTAYKESFGFDAPPYTYADLEESDVIVLVGSNLCIAHPILWERICRNQNSPEIIVIDPRVTETAVAATAHYQLQPKSDLTLLYGVARLLIEHDWVDQDFIARSTEGYGEFAAHVQSFTLERVSEVTGLIPAAIERLASSIHDGRRVSFWWTMGVNQSHEGTRTAQAIINLALMTGNIGRPGTGANSVTGQCNAMGSRLFSNTTNLLGGREFTNEEHRRRVADVLGLDPGLIPARPSWSYDRIVDAAETGEIKGLWIIGTNPAHSWIDQQRLHRALGRLEFLVVQDMYRTTETAQLAHLLLPAAGWGEKEGTFINSERRIGVIKRVAEAPGQALADFYIFKLIADSWGCADLFSQWSAPEATFSVLKRLSEGQPCDISAVGDYQMIDRHGGIQWPFAGSAIDTGEAMGERRLFEDGRFFHSNGRARFCFDDPRPVAEPPSAAYPLWLLTGRGTSSQWHTQTRTSKSAMLRSLSPLEPYVELAPPDAAARAIRNGDRVEISSVRATMHARATVTTTVRPGQVFVPMHYAETNGLTYPCFDPFSRQPSYKSAAVEIRRAGRKHP